MSQEEDSEEEMHCLEFTTLITEYEDNVLPPKKKEAFELHRSYCDGCNALLDGLKRSRQLTAAGRAEEGAVPQALIEAYRAQMKASSD